MNKLATVALKNLQKLLAVALLVVALSYVAPSMLTNAAPPTDFQTSLIASGLDGPSGFDIAPDGRIFVLERAGAVKIIKDGQLLTEPFAEFNSVASGDRGLIGIDFDPEFGVSNFWVYFYYTGQDLLNHIVRYDASTDVGTQGPFEIFATQSPSQQLHVGGTIQFGPDDKLYFAVGDNGYPPNAQDLTNPHGKILRINKDGTIPSDNPFYGQTDKLGSIWAYGFRNPWRFQFDEQNGQIIGGDVGDFTWEEVNRIEKGGNYGWPLHEGVCTQNCTGFTDPIHAYNHNGASAAVTGGPIYRGSMFPAEYAGSYFFGDYAQGFIKRATFNGDGSIDQITDFDAAAGSVVDMKIADDGSMYYITFYPGRMYRVVHNTSNPAPTAVASSDVTRGSSVPFTVNFFGSQSSDPNGDPLTFVWDFGDGTTSTLENPTHTYTQTGAYTVDLVVSDSENTSNAIPIVIQVGQPPVITIAAPAADSTYQAGDIITYNLFATDAAGFDLNDANISTDIVFHHDTHTHPFIDNQIGRVGSFTIPDTGEASANTWYEIAVTASDEVGVSSSKSIFIYPETITMTYDTQPSGLEIDLDGVPHTAPYAVKQVVGFQREASAPATQVAVDGTVYHFKEWSDGGIIRHFVTAPTQDTTLTATYEPSGSFAGEYFDNQNLQGAPVLVRQDPVIDFVWFDGSPDPSVPIDLFSVRWTKDHYFAPGQYTFTTATDDGVRLYIDGALVIDEWHDQGLTAYNYTTYLDGGNHTIVMEYFDTVVSATAKLSWVATPNQTPPNPSGWRGTYYNNLDLLGQPALIRGDADIDFAWGDGSPDPAIIADIFAVEWTKTDTFETTDYRFTTTSDDGIRVYIDDVLILDQWNDHPPTNHSVEVPVIAGPHDLKVEYYERYGGATAQVSYEKVDVTSTNEYTAEYFANTTLSGAPVLVRQETEINNLWGLGSPDPLVPNEQFSARWTKTDTFDAGTHAFTITADDGVRVFVDGQPIIDQWVDQSSATHTSDVVLTAGQHTVVVEYYENYVDAVAQFSYEKTGDPTPNEWHAHFYAGKGFDGEEIAHSHSDELNFDWGPGAPFVGGPTDDFSAIFTKDETFLAGTYTFNVTADDGVRVYIDDALVHDRWVNQSAVQRSFDVEITAGQHEIRMEYYEAYVDAVAMLSYAPAQIQPGVGFLAEFFDGIALAGEPLFTRYDDAIDFDWAEGSPYPNGPINTFSVRWSKTQVFETGTYRVNATSDDGIRVYIDNQLVLEEWNDHSLESFTVDVPITAGEYDVVVEYYDNYVDAVAQVTIEKL